ncbi:hypothetical protein [Siphonobacter sp. SORGH_AS_1065]|uniref:hypothetical protein n=1 Tax=Siphonobacter sp. SORGH_AS_1065 TaxID=3041795 RepID=UPI00278312FB|nr:hypothetical protein [Siphonobacter sp. SORGH_AS_1065]MDQ1090448.1 hypothetical protein [Siphonobacter sp. SORGH_AS_1065]
MDRISELYLQHSVFFSSLPAELESFQALIDYGKTIPQTDNDKLWNAREELYNHHKLLRKNQLIQNEQEQHVSTLLESLYEKHKQFFDQLSPQEDFNRSFRDYLQNLSTEETKAAWKRRDDLHMLYLNDLNVVHFEEKEKQTFENQDDYENYFVNEEVNEINQELDDASSVERYERDIEIINLHQILNLKKLEPAQINRLKNLLPVYSQIDVDDHTSLKVVFKSEVVGIDQIKVKMLSGVLPAIPDIRLNVREETNIHEQKPGLMLKRIIDRRISDENTVSGLKAVLEQCEEERLDVDMAILLKVADAIERYPSFLEEIIANTSKHIGLTEGQQSILYQIIDSLFPLQLGFYDGLHLHFIPVDRLHKPSLQIVLERLKEIAHIDLNNI